MAINISTSYEIKNTLGRAKAYLNKKEIVKGIMVFCEGIRLFMGSKIFGKDRLDIEYQLADLATLIKTIPEIKEYLPEDFGYVKGKEKKLVQDLIVAIKKIVKEIESGGFKEDNEAKEREERKKKLLDMLQEYLLKKNYMDATTIIRKIISEYGDSSTIFVDIANRFYAAKNFDKAIEFAKDALKKDPKNMNALRVMINSYRFLKNYEAAEKCYKKAIELFGEHGNIYFNMTKLYLEWDKKDAAKESIKKALELEPENEEYKAVAKKIL